MSRGQHRSLCTYRPEVTLETGSARVRDDRHLVFDRNLDNLHYILCGGREDYDGRMRAYAPWHTQKRQTVALWRGTH